MIQRGKVTGREIKKNRDGTKNVLLLQVEITDPDDIQTVEYMTPSGEDANPPNGSDVAIVSVGNAYKIAITADNGVEPVMAPGEKRLYSTSTSGDVAADLKFLTDGVAELNGNGDFAVRFLKLKEAFDQLKNDYNTHISNYNIHVHSNPEGGNTGVPTVTDSETEADMAFAKVENVKLSGAS